ncbi:MAG TPA: FkbM family methyltransferase [Phnomibacter sp.]|nr:FkbM family methyltransferase [Phnomibacter sp.]
MANFISKLWLGASKRLFNLFANPLAKYGISKGKIIVLKHQAAGKERKIKLLGRYFYYTSPAELVHGLQEIFEQGIYSQSFKSKPYIIDGGANVGLSAIYFKHLAPGAIIDAFEPDPVNAQLFMKNTAYMANVTLHQCALWKENTMLNFEMDGSMSSRLNAEGKDGKKIQQVQAVRLKDRLEKEVDFLKLDIEGAEYEVLKDIEDRLHLVKSMFVEYHGTYAQNNELLEILGIVNRAGFMFYIKEAANVHAHPLANSKVKLHGWDVQLNIFCLRKG